MADVVTRSGVNPLDSDAMRQFMCCRRDLETQIRDTQYLTEAGSDLYPGP
jgi:hypothetical protein